MASVEDVRLQQWKNQRGESRGPLRGPEKDMNISIMQGYACLYSAALYGGVSGMHLS